jgi:hypothetical protein
VGLGDFWSWSGMYWAENSAGVDQAKALISPVRTAAIPPVIVESTLRVARRRRRVWPPSLSQVFRTAPRCRAEGIRCWWAERASVGEWAVFGVGGRGQKLGRQGALFGAGAAGPVRAVLGKACGGNGAGCGSWPSNNALQTPAGRRASSLKAWRCSAPAASERDR